MWTTFRLTYPDSFTLYALLWVVRAGELHHSLVEMLSLHQSLTVMSCHVTGCSLVTMKPSTHWRSWPLPAACKRSENSHLLILNTKDMYNNQKSGKLLIWFVFQVGYFCKPVKTEENLSYPVPVEQHVNVTRTAVLQWVLFFPDHSLVLYSWKLNILLAACIYSSFLLNLGQIL